MKNFELGTDIADDGSAVLELAAGHHHRLCSPNCKNPVRLNARLVSESGLFLILGIKKWLVVSWSK